jgi:hypothetical protein
MSRPLLRLLLFLALSLSAGAWCAPADVLPARTIEAHNFVPSVLLYVGRESTQEFLRMRFHSNVSRAIVHLPPAHPLNADLGGGELDENPVTMPRLFVAWRANDMLLRAAPVESATAIGFSLASDSSWWLRYAHVVFTGAEMACYRAHCTGGGPFATLKAATAGLARAVWHVGTASSFEATVRATDVAAPVGAWSGLRVRVDLERAQTLLPPAILADLLAVPDRALFLRDAHDATAVLLLRADEAHEDYLVAPDLAQANASVIVIGHVLARRLLLGWAADVSGVVAIALVRNDPSMAGVSATLLGGAAVTAYLLAFWTTMLGGFVSLHVAAQDTVQRGRTLRHLILLVVAGTITHVLGLGFTGTGPVLAGNVAAAAQTFGLAYFLPGSLLNLAVLFAATFRVYATRVSAGRSSAAWTTLVAAHCVLVTRSLAVSLMPAATRTLFSALVLTVAMLVLVVVPGVYIAAIAIVRTARASRRGGDLPGWELLLAAASVVTLALNVVGVFSALVLPLLLTVNSRFSPLAVQAAAVVICAVPVFIGAVVASFEARTGEPADARGAL